MAEDEPRVTLVAVGSGGSRTRAWVAAGGLVGALLASVALGVFGGSGTPAVPRPSALPAQPSGAASDAAAATAPSAAAAVPAATPRRPRTIAPLNAGYEVEYARDPAHRPVVGRDGIVAIFGFGQRVPDGAYQGTIRVAVGTPARGAPVIEDGDVRFVYGRTLDELLTSYSGGEVEVPAVRSAFGVDRTLGVLLDFEPTAPGRSTRSVALLVSGNRAFVITATGFDELFPRLRNAASAGLVRFLANFRFTTPLYVDRELGFQASVPPGATASVLGTQAVLFKGDVTISVATGTETQPPPVQVLPGASAPVVRGAWGPDRHTLADAYVLAIGSRAGAWTPVALGDLPAIRVDDPNGLAATVLATDGERAFIVSVAEVQTSAQVEAFESFLAGFRPLPTGAAGG